MIIVGGAKGVQLTKKDDFVQEYLFQPQYEGSAYSKDTKYINKNAKISTEFQNSYICSIA